MSNYPVAPQYIKDFEQLGFGMFVHLGLYSQLNKGEWVYEIHHMDMEEYVKLFDTCAIGSMKHIVEVAKSAGCKYITLTTRHHDGFSLYDTRGLNTYDAPHSPVGKDLIAEFVEECRKADIVPVFYHTTLDWWHPDFNNDFDKYLDYLFKSVEILCTHYGKIGGMWFDGNWSKPDADWKEQELYQMIHRLQPRAIIVNNTGLSARGALGAEEIDCVTFERGMAEPVDLTGRTKYVAGEMCQTLCDHWGAADDINFKPVKQLIEELCECRKVGANFLLNVGPDADGTVPPMQAATMGCIGRWMKDYGKAIYNGRPYIRYEDKREFFLKDVNDPDTAYFFRFNPGQSTGDVNVSLELGDNSTKVLEKLDRKVKSMTWMDNGEAVPFTQDGDKLTVSCGGYFYGTSLCLRVAEVKFN